MRLLLLIIYIAALFSCKRDVRPDTASETKFAEDSIKVHWPESHDDDLYTGAASAEMFWLKTDTSSWQLRIDTITKAEFNDEKKVLYKESTINGDSLISAIASQFNTVIILEDSCLTLKALDQDIKLCRKDQGTEKSWTGYDGIGYENGFLIVSDLGYESGAYVCFNPFSQDYFYCSNVPHFSSDSLAYAAGHHYGEGEVELHDLKNHRRFSAISNYAVEAFYLDESSLYLKFSLLDRSRYLKFTW
jgi:hypothetical protein